MVHSFGDSFPYYICLGTRVYEVLDCRGQEEEQVELPTEAAAPQPTVIPGLDSITGDLLDLDLSAPAVPYQQAPVAAAPPAAAGGVDLLGDGLDNLVSRNFLEFAINILFLRSFLAFQLGIGAPAGAADPGMQSGIAGLSDIFGMTSSPASYVPAQEVWLPAARGKGLEISGTFSRKNKQVVMELTFTNRALQQMTGFAIQFNKNRSGAPTVVQS